jgi:hypothetical protein
VALERIGPSNRSQAAPAENNRAASAGPRCVSELVLGGDAGLEAIAAATAATAATAAPATAFTVVTTTTTAAVVPTAATIATTTATVATTAAAAATTTITAATTTVTAAATAAEATATAAAARLTLLRLVHTKRAAVQRATVHPLDRLGGFLGGPHGHEGKAAGATGLTVRDQVDIADRSEFLERRTYALCVGIER